jgi:hypothetical protein
MSNWKDDLDALLNIIIWGAIAIAVIALAIGLAVGKWLM